MRLLGGRNKNVLLTKINFELHHLCETENADCALAQ